MHVPVGMGLLDLSGLQNSQRCLKLLLQSDARDESTPDRNQEQVGWATRQVMLMEQYSPIYQGPCSQRWTTIQRRNVPQAERKKSFHIYILTLNLLRKHAQMFIFLLTSSLRGSVGPQASARAFWKYFLNSFSDGQGLPVASIHARFSSASQ